eukprot:747617-Hanusia_phi.AAC.1
MEARKEDRTGEGKRRGERRRYAGNDGDARGRGGGEKQKREEKLKWNSHINPTDWVALVHEEWGSGGGSFIRGCRQGRRRTLRTMASTRCRFLIANGRE